MLRYVLGVLMAALVGCGEVTPGDVPAAFAADVAEFYEVTGASLPVIIRYGTLEQPYRGKCLITWETKGTHRYVYRTITIDPASEPDTEWRRKALVWHEMAHCVYKLDHSNDPSNLMYPSDLGDTEPEVLEAYWRDVLHDQVKALSGGTP